MKLPRCGPLVSVVIPTFNRATQLPAAIDSVLAQSYPSVELIVVDDGSTDDTLRVLDRYGPRVRVLTQSNKGASAARNAGIAASHGDLLAFLDSDDLWLPGKLERQVQLLDRAGPGVPCCLSNMRLAYADGRSGSSFDLSLIHPSLPEGLWMNPLAVLATRFVLFNQAVLVRRWAIERVAGFDERCPYMEDYDLALRLALLGPWGFIAEPLAVWNEGSAGSLTDRAGKERLALQRTIHAIHEKLNALASTAPCSPADRRGLAFELRRNRFKLEATRLAHARSAAGRLCGRVLQRTEKIFDSVYTVSPWYPSMQVEAFGAAY